MYIANFVRGGVASIGRKRRGTAAGAIARLSPKQCCTCGKNRAYPVRAEAVPSFFRVVICVVLFVRTGIFHAR